MILPDSKSSARWETVDRKYLGEAFKAAGIEYDIQNAEGDKAKMATIADQMIAERRQGAHDRQPRLRRRPPPSRRRPTPPASRPSTTTASRSAAGCRRLRVVRQRRGRHAAGRGPRQVPHRPGRPRTRRSPCSTARPPTTTPRCSRGLRRRHQAAVRLGEWTRGRRPERAGLGQPEGRRDLRADAHEGRRQDRRRARRQRRPRRRGDRRPEEEQPAGARHRPGRHGRRSANILRATSA